jgi:hypothetical protein
MADLSVSGLPHGIKPYQGPPLPFSAEEIIRFGGCVYALASATTAATTSTAQATNQADQSYLPGQFDEEKSFVIELANRLTDAHIEATMHAAGLSGTRDVDDLLRRAREEGGIAAFLRARLGDDVRFDALGCAAGVAEIVVSVAGFAAAGSKEVGSAGIFTPAAVFTAAVSALWFAEGVAVVTAQC